MRGRGRGRRGKTKANMAITLSAADVTRMEAAHREKKRQCDVCLIF